MSSSAHAQEQPGFGPNPKLPEPQYSLFPTVNIAPATSWRDGAKPAPADGLSVMALATGLEHPRWLYTLPNGDILVAETNAPPKPEDGKGIKGWFMKLFMRRATGPAKSANRIRLLRDADGDGVAEVDEVFLDGLNSPFGMALIGDSFYVANTDAVLRFPYKDGEIIGAGVKVTDLPAGRLNHHWTKNIIASRDGKRLYATVGSNSNVGENGLDKEEGRAAIWEIDLETGKKRIFASGLRNPNGMAWEPTTGQLWTVVNERDELGNDLVPDYLTSVKDGGFYGWPYSYWGQHVDTRVKEQKPDLVATAIAPDYGLGAHSAALGLTFYEGTLLPEDYRGGAFIGLHGSWNREPRAGYKVTFVPFANGRPSGPPKDVLIGFVDGEGNAQGRPVGVAVDKTGALLVADDVGGRVWRVTPAAGAPAIPRAASQ
ncbi:sorbosone dehydrogenase family protein [Hyphomicrobium sp.]|uniref:PQQ-dependent sugar dehydrogenase n=1 Tax=Hyphomicrobium sp. TaxID=82 RepID=UPI0025BF7D06|nr:sorbosone dehydrogenase family protein [Hyphomicrobium sp.]